MMATIQELEAQVRDLREQVVRLTKAFHHHGVDDYPEQILQPSIGWLIDACDKMEEQEAHDAAKHCCADCGTELKGSEGEIFAVCSPCWNKHYGRDNDSAKSSIPTGGFIPEEKRREEELDRKWDTLLEAAKRPIPEDEKALLAEVLGGGLDIDSSCAGGEEMREPSEVNTLTEQIQAQLSGYPLSDPRQDGDALYLDDTCLRVICESIVQPTVEKLVAEITRLKRVIELQKGINADLLEDARDRDVEKEMLQRLEGDQLKQGADKNVAAKETRDSDICQADNSGLPPEQRKDLGRSAVAEKRQMGDAAQGVVLADTGCSGVDSLDTVEAVLDAMNDAHFDDGAGANVEVCRPIVERLIEQRDSAIQRSLQMYDTWRDEVAKVIEWNKEAIKERERAEQLQAQVAELANVISVGAEKIRGLENRVDEWRNKALARYDALKGGDNADG